MGTALLATLLGGALVFSGCGTSPAVVHSPNAAPSTVVVPWADLPASPAQLVAPNPASSEPAAPTSRACQAGQLASAPAGTNGAGGHLSHTWTVTNTGSGTCSLSGYPTVVATDAAHQQVFATDGTFFGSGGPPSDVAPGASVTLTLETDSSCAAHPGGAQGPVDDGAAVILPGGGGKLVLPDASLDVVCGLATTQFTPPAPPPPPMPAAPFTSLRASLTAPPSAAGGTLLVYRVTLANPTGTEIALDECPNFIESINGPDPAKELHQLNCAAAHPVPAEGAEIFEMHLRLPTSAAGPVTLGWAFAEPGSAPPVHVPLGVDPTKPEMTSSPELVPESPAARIIEIASVCAGGCIGSPVGPPAPAFTVYANGRLLAANPMTGHLVSASLSPVDQARAEQLTTTTIAGGDPISLRPGVGVADGSIDTITGWLDGGPHRASTQQLSDASLDGGVDAGRRRAFRQLEALVDQISRGGAPPVEASRLAVYAMPWYGAVASAQPWPGPSPATFTSTWASSSNPTQRATCTSLTGPPAQQLQGGVKPFPQIWTTSSGLFLVALRPLLPDEPDCTKAD